MHVTRMNPYRFEVLVMCSRAVPQFAPTVECSVWATDDERLLGVVILDLTDRDFNFVILARDKRGRFRCVDVGETYFTRRLAEKALIQRMPKVHARRDIAFEQGDETGEPLDFFTPQLPHHRLHPNFLAIADGPGDSAAREIISEMAHVFEEPDGNFVKDFQSTGFNSRLWELYLFAALVEEEFKLDRSHEQPDFIALTGDRRKIAIEATTVNPTIGNDGKPVDPPKPTSSEDLKKLLRDYMPIKFGGPLFGKLKKRDWERSHIKGLPYAIAIADFHGPETLTWSGPALSSYLFGLEVDLDPSARTGQPWHYRPIAKHIWKEKQIPSCFFNQPDAENVSAVLFTNSGTLAKFNRMGVLADYGDPGVRMIRMGTMLNPDTESTKPIEFTIDVDDPKYSEGWADELQVFHNPNAVCPLGQSLFPKATHHFLKDGQVKSYSLPYKVLQSVTIAHLLNARGDDAKL